jgi:hypothetical protein
MAGGGGGAHFTFDGTGIIDTPVIIVDLQVLQGPVHYKWFE